jgi:hypothetical protein
MGFDWTQLAGASARSTPSAPLGAWSNACADEVGIQNSRRVAREIVTSTLVWSGAKPTYPAQAILLSPYRCDVKWRWHVPFERENYRGNTLLVAVMILGVRMYFCTRFVL